MGHNPAALAFFPGMFFPIVLNLHGLALMMQPQIFPKLPQTSAPPIFYSLSLGML